jgi:hypothetical protein
LNQAFRLLQSCQTPPLWLAASVATATLAGAALLWKHTAEQRVQRAIASLVVLENQRSMEAQRPSVHKLPKNDFAHALPTSTPLDPIVRDLQRFSAASMVNFVSLDASSRGSTTRMLGRTEFDVSLRGEYVKLKSVLGQLVDRHPQLLVQRISLRRLSGPTDLEVAVQLVLLSKPLAISALGN